MPHRPLPHPVDSGGKVALVHLILDQVRTAVDFIDVSLQTNKEEYLKNYSRVQTDL
jgi:hypothetical protein